MFFEGTLFSGGFKGTSKGVVPERRHTHVESSICEPRLLTLNRTTQLLKADLLTFGFSWFGLF